MIRTIQWDDKTRRWFYYCGEDKAYVRLQDAEGNLVTEPPTEETQDDERITDLQPV